MFGKIGFIFCLLGLVSTATLAQEDDKKAALDAYLKNHTYIMTNDNGALIGEGADWLENQFQDQHFVLMGESHGVADIAKMAGSIYEKLAPLGFDRAAIEVDPWSTPKLEKMLRSPDNIELVNHFSAGMNLLSIPFYSWREESDYLNKVIELSGKSDDILWGVDQVFIAAGELVLEDLVSMAKTEGEISASTEALTKAKGVFGYVGMSPNSETKALKEAFSQSKNGRARQLASEIDLSNEIYSPFTGRGGETIVANTIRENYMKDKLTLQLKKAIQKEGEIPKVFFKFGGYHMMWGHSGTNVLSLGNFVKEYAQLNGLKAMNFLVTCSSGEQFDIQAGGGIPCEPYLEMKNKEGEPSLLVSKVSEEGISVIDTKSIRYSPHFRSLDEESKNIVLAFDVLILIPNTKASTLHEGKLPTFN